VDYVVQYKTAAANSYSTSSSFIVSGQTTARISGLSSGTSYTFRVFARTASNSTSSANVANSTVTKSSTSTLTTPSAPTVAATSNTLKSIDVSWSAISNASSYTLKLYSASNSLLSTSGLTGLSGTSATITTSNFASLADLTAYKVSITAIGNGSSYLDSSESAKSDVTTTGVGRTPEFGAPTATADGYTVSITNYSDDYTWATPTVSAGSVAVTSTVGATRVLTVTGLSPGASATITQNTTRSGYANGSATVTGTATTVAQTITRTSTSPTSPVVGANYTPAATASSGLSVAITIAAGSSSICAISSGVVTFNAAGSCVIHYNQAGNASYSAATQVSETLTIGKGTPTFSAWSGVSKTFGDSPFTVTAPTVSGALAGSFTYSSATTSVISISGTTLTVEGGGSSLITATFTPTDTTNYNTATTTMTVTVSRATQTVTWAPTTALLTTASPATPSSLATALGAATISYEVTSAGTSSCTVDSSTGVLTFTAAGSCTVRASAAQSANYAAATKDVTFVITQATRTITITQGSNGTISPGTTSVNYGSNQTFTFTPATGYSVASITVNGVALTGSALTNAIASGYTFSNVITTHTLTASYSINTFTITLSSGANGSGGNQILTKTYGISLTLPNSATANGYFTRTGYTVTGWTTTDGSAQTHALAASFTTEAITTLYPVWSARTDNGITYNNQGATTAQIGGSTTYTTAAAIGTIPTTPPVKTDFAFKGWYTSASGGTQVTDGSYTPASPFGTVTLYAQWNSTNATLSNLTLSSGTLSPTFDAGRFIYTASVANTVATGFTVTATKGESNASVIQYRGATGVITFDNTLNIGANIIRTLITAQDGLTTVTYTLTVTRAPTPPTTSVINPDAPTVTLTAFTTTFLQTNPIAAQVNTPSRVTFLVNNRVIPGCTAIKTVSSGVTHTATCKYRPTSLGSLTVSATITPNSTDYLAASTSIKVTVRPK